MASLVTSTTHSVRVHGGPDGGTPARHDFSTNANAVGPCPAALAAVRAADARRYPDAGFHALRDGLAQHHGVARERILLAASASEFIQRVTAVSARIAPGPVAVPLHAYGDYAAAAQAWGRALVPHRDTLATLRWHCDPSSPCGQDDPASTLAALTVLDAVYAPLRLQGESSWSETQRDAVFELHSPNKALGLTGIRGAYVISPRDADGELIRALDDACPSWPLGTHAVAMLEAWTRPAIRQWLADARRTLLEWKHMQVDMLGAMGAQTRPGIANFFCVRLPEACSAGELRRRGIAVRDAASFGLAGWTRMSVQPPASQHALQAVMEGLMSSSVRTRAAA